MLQLFTSLDLYIDITLVIALIFVFIYEIINGFHDAANAVTTVIYTKALKPNLAVLISGVCNFFGVLFGGLSVAYSIVHLLPIDFLLMKINSFRGLAMIFSMLLSAILWNLGTWYFGLPASSSHTLIGSIIGVTFIHAWLTKNSILQELHLSHLIEIFLSLIFSPLIGFIFSAAVLLFLRCCFNINNSKFHYIHLTPEERCQRDGISKPPIFIRIGLIISSAGVSFSHGSNDGQKGIGLIMLVLMGIAPVEFVVNLSASTQDICRTNDAVVNFYKYCIQNYDIFNFHVTDFKKELISLKKKDCSFYTISLVPVSLFYFDFFINDEKNILFTNCIEQKFVFEDMFKKNYLLIEKQSLYYNISRIMFIINHTLCLLKNLDNYNQLDFNQRIYIRYLLISISDIISKVEKIPNLSVLDKIFLSNLKKDLLNTIEYAPIWIVISVALSLSLGTIIGWKRVAITIGERIGKKSMTYAQGLLSQVISAISIGIASYIGKPVSTTHVLSSSIVGTMLVQGNGIRAKTIKNILMAWILTLPVTMFLSGSLYLFFLFVIIFLI
ncbi:Probable low-affinity inorganic phosphate transporter 2 [Candidatus Westeberhardia cardiocondylae]|uniref:Phosphate transporter n=1 Tax=Candidatus Westeberhardia cardiocondylae TaxID=1594731 RepID=A0A0H5BWK7_9ENTR|nr:inorganic phosphate transporter [Candidatus Westeberhardia cardiocondylae]MCR3756151.1 metal phosphate:H(+) symporter PitB [Candidatus Westeberhardia cardiocondylae]CEN32028.1 Probable low-affinity inorganic phosphate transporter 2 [Candidatus Westeberhardia cardiocondylae]